MGGKKLEESSESNLFRLGKVLEIARFNGGAAVIVSGVYFHGWENRPLQVAVGLCSHVRRSFYRLVSF